MVTTMEQKSDLASTFAAQKIDPQNYFVVRASMWDPKTEDYTRELAEGKGERVYREFINAFDFYNQAKYSDLVSGKGQDVNMELVHFRMGRARIVQSRVVFP
ncbi:MAG: hypothetical protein COV67_00350 [Nitrospinae bacterium CG11_big_fil_rev_8_21_14_0_20_56_8]|nr:MAG: hypothetical protein COV67_00350 [Nitrospinae bacterium CG11_big_fil_rev_8_21_14_0_20_56_8]